jgi:hypothetical protein
LAAARSDRFASEIGRGIQPSLPTSAAVTKVWLVWKRQNPDLSAYTFTREQALHLRG